MRRQTLSEFAIVAGAALLLAACGKERPVEAAIQTVTAGTAEQIQPDVPERYSASIDPIAQVDLAFKSGGIVERILEVRGADGRMRNVQAGDKVAKDTELAQVRPLDYQHRVDEAEAQRAQAEAQVAQAQAQLAQVRAQLTQAQAGFNEAEIEFRRSSNLFQSDSLVKPQFDQAKGRYDAQAASVKAAEASVTAVEATVRASEASVANTRAAVSGAQLSLSDTSLRAPFAGWISARNVDRGSIVGSTSPGFSMMDTHLVKAVFAVPDSTLPSIRLGQKQSVTLDALQRPVPGVITSISPQADPKSRVFSVEVTVDNSREDVRPGMIGSLTLGAVRDTRPRLVVPLSAVVRAPANPNGFAVFRLTEQTGKTFATAQIVGIGQTFGNSIEITEGLRAGQRIIALGGSLVRDGQEVRVLP